MRIDRRKLATIMFDKDITVKKLAEDCCVSRQTISSIRHGKSCINTVGNAIAKTLNVNVTEILED